MLVVAAGDTVGQPLFDGRFEVFFGVVHGSVLRPGLGIHSSRHQVEFSFQPEKTWAGKRGRMYTGSIAGGMSWRA